MQIHQCESPHEKRQSKSILKNISTLFVKKGTKEIKQETNQHGNKKPNLNV